MGNNLPTVSMKCRQLQNPLEIEQDSSTKVTKRRLENEVLRDRDMIGGDSHVSKEHLARFQRFENLISSDRMFIDPDKW
jgi:hypothetical protein